MGFVVKLLFMRKLAMYMYWGWVMLADNIRNRQPHRWSQRRHLKRYIIAMAALIFLLSIVGMVAYFSGSYYVKLQFIKALKQVTGGDVELNSNSIQVRILSYIRVKDLRVYLPAHVHTADNMVFSAGDVIFYHNPVALLKGHFQLEKMIADKARLIICYDDDNKKINLQELKFSKLGRYNMAGAVRPRLVLRNSIVEYHEITDGKCTPPTRQQVQGVIFPDTGNPDTYDFKLWVGTEMSGSSALYGSYDLQSDRLEVNGKFLLDKLNINFLPPRLTQWQKLYNDCNPRGILHINSTYIPHREHKLKLELTNAAFDVPLGAGRGTLGVTKAQADIDCTDSNVFIKNISGYLENICKVSAAGTIGGYNRNASFNLNFKTLGLDIPAGQWREFEPNMPMVAFNGERKRTMLPGIAGNVSAGNKVVNGNSVASLYRLMSVMPYAIRKLIGEYKPEGKLQLSLQVRRNFSAARLVSGNTVAASTNGNKARYDSKRHYGNKQPVGSNIDYHGVLRFLDGKMLYRKFPYPLYNVKGAVVFDPNHVGIGPLYAHNGEGKGRIEISGLWQRQKRGRPLHVDIRAKNIVLDDTLYRAIPAKQRGFRQQFSPSGYVDVDYAYNRIMGKEDNAHNVLDVRFGSLKACYWRLPVALSNVKGNIHIAGDNLRFNIVDAKASSGHVSLSGDIAGFKKGSGKALCKIKFKDIVWNQNLADALGRRASDMSRELALKGIIDGSGELYFITSQPKKNVGDTNNLRQANGKYNFSHKTIPAISTLAGHGAGNNRTAAVLAAGSGIISGNRQGKTTELPGLEAAGDYHIKFRLHDGEMLYRKFDYHLGNLDITGDINNKRLRIISMTGQKPAQLSAARPVAASIKQPAKSLAKSAANSAAKISEFQSAVKPAGPGYDRISIRGNFYSPRQYQFHIDGNKVEITPSLIHKISGSQLSLLKRIDITGRVDFGLDISRAPVSSMVDYKASITLRNCMIQPVEFKYNFSNVNGYLRVKPGRIDIEQLSCVRQQCRMDVNGVLEMPVGQLAQVSSLPDIAQVAQVPPIGQVVSDGRKTGVSAGQSAGQYKYQFNVSATEFPLDSRLRNALPVRYRSVFNRLNPGGTVNIKASLSYNKTAGSNLPNVNSAGIWNIDARVLLHNVEIHNPTDMDNMNASITTKLTYNDLTDNLKIDGNILHEDLYYRHRPLHNLTAGFTYDSRKKILQVNDISGEFCHGRLSGQVRALPFAVPLSYDVNIQLLGIDLAEFVNAGRAAAVQDRKLKGNFNGCISLTQPADGTLRRGSFLVVIKDAVLGRLPIVARILSVLNLTLPGNGAFNSASLSGHIAGTKTHFDNIHMQGKSLSLTGSGIMTDPDGQLRLVFVVDSPRYLQHIPVLSSFIKAVKPEIMQVRVSGTFDNPVVSPTAFPALNDALRGKTNKDRNMRKDRKSSNPNRSHKTQ